MRRVSEKVGSVQPIVGLVIDGVRMVLQAFGWRGLLRRVSYESRLRSGVLRRQLPATGDFEGFDPVGWSHRFDLDKLRDRYAALPDRDNLEAAVLADARRVLDGETRLYGWAWKPVGWPPRWHRNPFTGHDYARRHWTEISDDDPDSGDIKDVWELSRLPATFLLARAYVLTDDARYPEAWWQAVEDWAEHNPPNLGVNWRCGQETSLRGIALCFGLSVFAGHPVSTPVRLALAGRMLRAHLDRVLPTVGYALSQRNNHAVSELVFLLSVLGPERRLIRLLGEVLDDQFYPDGSYSQQSFNYQRLAVQALQWLLVARDDLPQGLRDRVVEVLARSRDFLTRCAEPVSGWMPNYGANDGALLFPLSQAHHRDLRPVLASLGAEIDPADHTTREPGIWLADREVNARRTAANQAPSTYVTLRGPRSLLLTRVGTGRHRPGHADQMAVDLWIDGHNLVPDPGSYRYTAPPPWRNALTGVQVHAMPRHPEEAEIMIGRFLRAGLEQPAEVVQWEAKAPGCDSLLLSREVQGGSLLRAVVREADRYLVLDVSESIPMVVRWNLDVVEGLEVRIAPSTNWRAQVGTVQDPRSGWSSPLYAQRSPVTSVEVDVEAGQVVALVVARSAEVAGIDTLVSGLPERFTARHSAKDARSALAGALWIESDSLTADVHEP